MNHAIEILAALDKSFVEAPRSGYPEVRGHIHAPDYDLTWIFGPRRLGKCKPNVLSIKTIELSEEIRGTGILTEVIERIRTGEPAPRIPLQFLHFQECSPNISRLLRRLDFERYDVGHTTDWWTPITGQKGLAL